MWTVPLKTKESQGVAEAFNEIIKQEKIPEKVHTDNKTEFAGILKEVCEIHHIKMIYGASYQPNVQKGDECWN